MTKQIICNVIMFLSNIAQFVYDWLWLHRLSKNMKKIADECSTLPREESFKFIQKIIRRSISFFF